MFEHWYSESLPGSQVNFLSVFCFQSREGPVCFWIDPISHFPALELLCLETQLCFSRVFLQALFSVSFFCSDFLSLWRCGCNLAIPPAGMRGFTRGTDKEREKQNGSIKRNQTGVWERCWVWLFCLLLDSPPSHVFSLSFSH